MQLVMPQPTVPSLKFIERLIAFYKHQPAPDLSTIWKGVTSRYHAPLVFALDHNNADMVADILAAAYENSLVWGIDDTWPNISRDRQGYIDSWKRQLARLATMVGVLPSNNPEQPFETVQEPEILVKECEAVIGMPFYHTGGGHRPCMEIDGRFIPLKLLNAAAIFWVLQTLQTDRDGMLEIGAGTGINGDVLYRPYHTVDLPVTSVIQAYLLETSNGDGFVTFAGDKDDYGVRIHGLNKPDQPFPIILNQDSMPEMTLAAAQGYLDYIEEHLISNGYFVSINHESSAGGQHRVFNLMRERNAFRLVQRSPWWMRDGYLLEIWQRL